MRVVDDACERYGIDDRAKVVVGGFSQGACLALACAKSELSDVGGVLAVRGYLPGRSREFRDLRPNTLIAGGSIHGSARVVVEAGRLTGGDVVIARWVTSCASRTSIARVVGSRNGSREFAERV